MPSVFQNRINSDLPYAVEGDFASANPRASQFAGEAALVSGPLGLTVGRFAWVNGNQANNFATGAVRPQGFVHREMQASIVNWLDGASMVIQAGRMVTLHDEGDFYARVAGNTPATYDAQVYANFADGSISFGSAPTGASATGSIGSTFTATGAGNQLTTSAVTGFIGIGDTISGPNIPANTTILSQVSGTPNGAGVYTTSAATTINNATATSFGNTLYVSAVSSGLLTPGVAISGTGVPANASIASQQSGATGGAGVYTLNTPATAYAASTALTTVGGILTNFYARASANVGELVPISTWGKL